MPVPDASEDGDAGTGSDAESESEGVEAKGEIATKKMTKAEVKAKAALDKRERAQAANMAQCNICGRRYARVARTNNRRGRLDLHARCRPQIQEQPPGKAHGRVSTQAAVEAAEDSAVERGAAEAQAVIPGAETTASPGGAHGGIYVLFDHGAVAGPNLRRWHPRV